jgi:hypothetical protein
MPFMWIIEISVNYLDGSIASGSLASLRAGPPEATVIAGFGRKRKRGFRAPPGRPG